MHAATAFVSVVSPTLKHCSSRGSFLPHAHVSSTSPRRVSLVPKRRRVQAPCATVVEPGEGPNESVLESFSSSVRGEWTGYEGTFDATTGQVLTIPDFYIPDQFTEWELEPKGFETNHSVIVRNDKLYRKFFRILPTVTLFADHVDYEEDLDIIPLSMVNDDDTDSNHHTSIYADGSFVSGAAQVLTKRESKLQKWPKLAFRLCDSEQKKVANVWLSFDFEQRKLVGDVRAVIETWDCDHCDGANLEGSSGFVDGWPSSTPGSPESLHGTWKTRGAAGDGERSGTKSEGAVFLPGGIDVSVEGLSEGGLSIQTGWKMTEKTRCVLRRQFGADGKVLYTEHLVEDLVQ